MLFFFFVFSDWALACKQCFTYRYYIPFYTNLSDSWWLFGPNRKIKADDS